MTFYTISILYLDLDGMSYVKLETYLMLRFQLHLLHGNGTFQKKLNIKILAFSISGRKSHMSKLLSFVPKESVFIFQKDLQS